MRRAELAAHTAEAPGSETPASRRQQPDPVAIAETERRFGICKACAHLRDDGCACALYDGCCFGRFRANPMSRCPARKW